MLGTQAGQHHRLHGVPRTLHSLLLVELLSEDSSDLELGALWSQDGCCYSSRSCGSQKPLGQSVWGDAGDASGVGLRGVTVQPDSGVLASLCPQHLQGRAAHPPWSVSVSPSPGATPAQAHSTHRPRTNCRLCHYCRSHAWSLRRPLSTVLLMGRRGRRGRRGPREKGDKRPHWAALEGATLGAEGQQVPPSPAHTCLVPVLPSWGQGWTGSGPDPQDPISSCFTLEPH